MKTLVYLDEDGHFHMCSTNQRALTLEHMRKLHYGDVWANELVDALDEVGCTEAELKTISQERFDEFLSCFSARGLLEILSM
jgi:truncated hemoglobin YjbI